MEERRGRMEGKERILLGRWTVQSLDRLLLQASGITDSGSRIAFLSERFLGTPYKENTLRGGPEVPEILTLNLEEVDCYTYLDYVEAMRLSASFSGLLKMLRRIRYRAGEVSYFKRNHFFIDWREANRRFVADVTRQVGGTYTRIVTKILNRKEDGSPFLSGIPESPRRLAYLPAEFTGGMVDRLRTGDYGGIYSETAGLDVSHTGIIVLTGGKTLFRHASSLQRKVVEEELGAYLKGKPGLVLLRPRLSEARTLS